MLAEILTYLLRAIGSLFEFALLLRFVLQAVRADFYNPLSQAIVQITNPVVRPLRKVVPGLGGLDIASLLAAWLTALLVLTGTVLLQFGGLPPLLFALAQASLSLLLDVLWIYIGALFIGVVSSWVAPGSYHPVLKVVDQISAPLLAPIRRVLPPMGGLDFSVMVALMVLFMIKDIVLPGLFGR